MSSKEDHLFEAPPTEIIVTAARTPEEERESAASVTIIDADRIERLGEPQVAPLLRLIPSVAISTSGPAGSLTEVRIRGAEANHTLLFIDGIRANDPAAGNTPRFELLNADIVSRIEIVRGPQSALWGSEAIGGVIAVDGPASAVKGVGGSAATEAGSFGFVRAAAAIDAASDNASLSAGIGWQRATGIDSFVEGRPTLSKPGRTAGATGLPSRTDSRGIGFSRTAQRMTARSLTSSTPTRRQQRTKLAPDGLGQCRSGKGAWSGRFRSLLGSSTATCSTAISTGRRHRERHSAATRACVITGPSTIC